MNAKQRLYNFLEGKKVDRPPNLNIIMTFAAKYINEPYSSFCQNFEKLVEGNLTCCKDFHIDILSTMSDPYRETMDFGTKLEFPYDDLPHCSEPLLKSIEEVKDLNLFDPMQSTRILDRIRAIGLYKERYGDEYPIMGWIEGPLAESCDLRGINDAMMDLLEEEQFNELLEKCAQQGIRCAETQIKAGADIIGIGDAAASIIGRTLYDEKIFPYEKMVIQAIKEMGAKVRLHICGDITHLLPKIKELEVDILDIDYKVDMGYAIEMMSGISVVNGNLNPIELLTLSPEEVYTIVKSLKNAFGHKACISAGCEIPKNTDPANLIAFARGLQ